MDTFSAPDEEPAQETIIDDNANDAADFATESDYSAIHRLKNTFCFLFLYVLSIPWARIDNTYKNEKTKGVSTGERRRSLAADLPQELHGH
jgi:hypothetical protein